MVFMTKPDDLPLAEVVAALERRQPLEAVRMLLRSAASAKGQTPKDKSLRAPSLPRPEPARVPAALPPELHALRDGLSPGEVPPARAATLDWVLVFLLVVLAYPFLSDWLGLPSLSFLSW